MAPGAEKQKAACQNQLTGVVAMPDSMEYDRDGKASVLD